MTTQLSQRYRYLATPEAVEVLCAAQAGEIIADGDWSLADASEQESSQYDLQIVGVLVTSENEADFFRDWGIAATSYQAIRERIDTLLLQDKKTINIYVDSPGGYVAGIEKVVKKFELLKKHKYISVRSEGMIASAAYWLASISNRISVSSLAQVGSVGAYTTITDSSKWYERNGITTHMISSGKMKGAGHPGTEVTPELIEAEQKIIDSISERFYATVEKYRYVSDGYKDGGIYLADEALKMGLIEHISDDEGSESETDNKKETAQMAKPTKHVLASEAMPEEDEEKEVAVETTAEDEEETETETDEQVGNGIDEEKDAPAITEDTAESTDTETVDDDEEKEEDGVAAEKARCLGLIEAFAFAPEFARRMIKSGTSVEAAKVQAYDLGLRAVHAGAPKLANVNASATDLADPNEPAILAQARARAKADGIPLYKAMEQIAKQNPQAYAAYFRGEK